MAAVFDVDHTFFIDARLHVIILRGHNGKGSHHVDARDSPGRLLDPQDLGSDGVPHLAEQTVFQGIELVLRSQDHVLQLLQFIRCVPLGVGQRLLADKVIGNHPFKGVCHFEVISKYLVVLDFQILDSGLVALSRFQFGKPRLPFRLRMAQLIRLLVIAVLYDAPVTQGYGRVLHDGAGDKIVDIL